MMTATSEKIGQILLALSLVQENNTQQVRLTTNKRQVGYCLSVQLLSNMARSIRELGTITFQASISKVVNTRREQD